MHDFQGVRDLGCLQWVFGVIGFGFAVSCCVEGSFPKAPTVQGFGPGLRRLLAAYVRTTVLWILLVQGLG